MRSSTVMFSSSMRAVAMASSWTVCVELPWVVCGRFRVCL